MRGLTKVLVGSVGDWPVYTVSVRCDAAVDSPRRLPLDAVNLALNLEPEVGDALGVEGVGRGAFVPGRECRRGRGT